MGYKKLLAERGRLRGLNIVRCNCLIVDIKAGIHFTQLIRVLAQFFRPSVAGVFIDRIKRNTLLLTESNRIIKERLIPVFAASIKNNLCATCSQVLYIGNDFGSGRADLGKSVNA